MDKKRSSLKRSSSATENREGTMPAAAIRPKRRISFSGRKSVREFSAAEKPKTWDNSYEISDPVNVSDGNSTCKGVIRKSTTLKLPESAEEQRVNNVKSKSSFLASDYVGVGLTTLLKSYENKQASIKFSHCGAENNVLRQFGASLNRENTENVRRELYAIDRFSNTCTKSTNMDLENTLICCENMQESIAKEDKFPNSTTTERVTLYTSEPILMDNEEKNVSATNRLTILQTSDMDLSFECKPIAIDKCIEEVNNTKYTTCLDISQSNLSDCYENVMSFDTNEITKNASEQLLVISQRTEDKNDRYLKSKDTNRMTCMDRNNKLKYEYLYNKGTTNLNPSKSINTPINAKSPKVVRKTCELLKATVGNDLNLDDDSTNTINLTSASCRSEFNKNLLNSSNDVSALEFASPLFPEFLTKNKKMNFRELNDGIVHGKIVVFPKKETEVNCENSVEDCVKLSTHFNEIKIASDQEQTVTKSTSSCSKETPENLSDISMDIQVTDDSKISENENVQIINLQASRKSDVEFSNTENMLLENTSFLVRAKFDDESTSRHKCVIENVNSPNVLNEMGELKSMEGIVGSDEQNVIVNNKTFGECNYAQMEILDRTKRKSIYEIQDMSLNDSNVVARKNDLTEISLSAGLVNNGDQKMSAISLKENEGVLSVQKTIIEDQSFHIEPMTEKPLTPIFTQSIATENGKGSDEVKQISAACQKSVRRRTVIFSTNCDIPSDDSLIIGTAITTQDKVEMHNKDINPPERAECGVEAENLRLQQLLVTKLSNPAPRLSRQHSLNTNNVENDSLILKLNEARAVTFSNSKRRTVYFEGNGDMSTDVSPLVNTEQKAQILKLYDGTPHRSVIEFECLELEAEEEQKRYEEEEKRNKGATSDKLMKEQIKIISTNDTRCIVDSRRKTTHETFELDVSGVKPLQNDKFDNSMEMSPALNFTSKRSTSNLTPNLPLSKKRQTLMFSNLCMEESFVPIDNFKENHSVEHMNMKTGQDNSDLNVDEKCITSNPNETTIEMEITLQQEEENENVKGTDDICSNIELLSNNQRENSPRTLQTRTPVFMEIANDDNNSILSQCATPEQLNDTDPSSFTDTIEVVRRATVMQKDKSINLLSGVYAEDDQNAFEYEKRRSVVSAFEDNPITISDVSTHYLAQRSTFAIQQEDKEGEKEGLIDLYTNSTINRIANFKKDYINLTRGNSSASLSDEGDIDKTRLSLVESLLCDDDEDDDDEDEELEVEKTCCEDREASTGEVISNGTMKGEGASLCYRCRRCQETLKLDGTLTPIESFTLPPTAKFPDLGLEQLQRLRQRPTIADVHEYWRKRSLERSFSIGNLSASSEQLSHISQEAIKGKPNAFTEELENIKRIERGISELSNIDITEASNQFVKRLDTLMSEACPNWIFDYQMQARKLFRFYHKKIITFNIVIAYENKDVLRNSLVIKSIQIQSSRMPSKNWKPIDFLMHFQLQSELPFDLMSVCNNSTENGVLDFIKTVDRLCQRVVRIGTDLWKLVCRENAILLRENGQIIIQKSVRQVFECDESYTRIQKRLFRIDLKNINTLSFKDIVFPPLYSFREDIQYLPNGINFLRLFLNNPTNYLKDDVVCENV